MKAIVITKAGGPQVLQIKNVEKPRPAANEVLVRVKAAGLNRSDIMTRENPKAYGKDTSAVSIPGLEIAGEIVEIGGGVTSFEMGDKICALVASGAYAEYISVNATHCLPIPKNLNYIEAASLPETLFTVWFNVFQQAKLKQKERLLIHGGTSGIGVMGLQMAKALGHKIYSTVGTDEKANFIKDHQLGSVVNYKKQKFEEVFKEENIDVILDMVGGDYTQKNLEILNTKGRLVYINGMKGLNPKINLWTIMSKNLKLTGSLLKPQPPEVKSKIATELQEHIWPFFSSGKIKPMVYKTFALEEASKAHKLMESSEHIGKIILEIN